MLLSPANLRRSKRLVLRRGGSNDAAVPGNNNRASPARPDINPENPHWHQFSAPFNPEMSAPGPSRQPGNEKRREGSCIGVHQDTVSLDRPNRPLETVAHGIVCGFTNPQSSATDLVLLSDGPGQPIGAFSCLDTTS